jgi:site-specific DNA recombinase
MMARRKPVSHQNSSAIAPTRLVIYRRVSTSDQAEDGVSLGAQQDQLRRYCEAVGATVVGDFEDVASGGSTAGRSGLEAALRAVELGQADGIAVHRLDRLTRSTRDLVSVAQWEREALADRTSAAMRELRRRSRHCGGRPPFGFEVQGDGSLVPAPAEHPVALLIRGMAAQGFRPAAIQRELERRQCLGRTGRPFRAQEILRIVRSPDFG